MSQTILLNVWWWFLVVVGLGFLIFVHELGHFLVAKACGVKVRSFSLGFWKPIFGFTWRGTYYAVRVIPLGGYVDMAGENPAELAERAAAGPVNPSPDEFIAKPVWQRVLIIFAGPFTNLVVALPLICLLFVFPRTQILPVVGSVDPNGVPASKGVAAGDRILTVDGRETRAWEDFHMRNVTRFLGDRPVVLEMAKPDGARYSFSLPPPADKTERDPGFSYVWPHRIQAVSPGHPAEAAGLKRGDEILEVGPPGATRVFEQWEEFQSFVRARPGEKIEIVVRGGEGAKSGDRKAFALTTAAKTYGFVPLKMEEGLFLAGKPPPGASFLRTGDRIADADGKPVRTLRDWRAVLAQAGTRRVAVRADRGGKLLDGAVEVVFDPVTGKTNPPLELETGHYLEAGDQPLAVEKGLRRGDRLLAGPRGRFDVQPGVGLWFFPKAGKPPETPIFSGEAKILFSRGAREMKVFLRPQDKAVGIVGVEPNFTETGIVRYSLGDALRKAPFRYREIVENTVLGLKQLFQFKLSLDELGGPVKIAGLAYHQARAGLDEWISILAFISINLAIVNLLPIPVLDGGWLTFLLIEFLRGKPLPPKAMTSAQYTGLVFLVALIILVTINDIIHPLDL